MRDTVTAATADLLVDYIRSLPDFVIVQRGESYQHMGALITDAMLQSGMRYDAQVQPRVQRILREYPAAITASAFAVVLAEHTPQQVVGINGRKAHWVAELTDFFIAQGVETVGQLRDWLQEPQHERLLRARKGIGLKTANYLKLLAGIEDHPAVDTHLRAFLGEAGIFSPNDRVAGQIIAETARRMGISAGALDASIWSYRARPSSGVSS